MDTYAIEQAAESVEEEIPGQASGEEEVLRFQLVIL